MIGLAALPLDDAQQILVVLAVLYGVECCRWLRGDSRRLLAGRFSRWSDFPRDPPAVDGWRLSAANPLPWAESFTAERFAFPFDATRVLLPILDHDTGREHYVAVDLDALEPVLASDGEVVSGDRRLGAFSSPALATTHAARLERLRATPSTDRPAVAEDLLAEAWSLPAAAARLDRWQRASRGVRVLGGWLTVAAFVAAPLAYAFRGRLPANVPLGLVAGFVVLWLWTAITGLRLRVDDLPEGHRGWTHRLVTFCSPASAMRLFDTAGHDVLAGFEPLVVVLATRAGGGPAAATAWLRDAVFPGDRGPVPPVDAAGAAALRWFRDRSAALARRAVADAGLDPDVLLAPPAAGPDVRSYCPGCGRQFSAEKGDCDACGLASIRVPGSNPRG